MDKLFRCGKLRSLLKNSEKNGTTLLDELESLLNARVQDTDEGRFLTSTSSNGNSCSWQLSPGRSIEHYVSLAENLISHYKTAKATLILLGTSAPTDWQIYDKMVGQITDHTSGLVSLTQMSRSVL